MLELRAIAAGMLSRTRLCRTVAVPKPHRSGAGTFAKSRLRHSELLLQTSRLMPWISPGVSGLKLEAWIAWERQAWRMIHGIELETTERALIMPELPGVRLCDYLRSRESSPQEKLSAFGASLAALRRAHEMAMRWPDGSIHAFSHSDAHAGNVCYETGSGKSRWFDFETIHDCRAGDAWRHADDLRALAWSAAACVSRELWPDIATATLEACGDDIRRELLRISGGVSRRAHLLHLSQAPMPQSAQREFAHVLQGTHLELLQQ
jgi:hypothetical protein